MKTLEELINSDKEMLVPTDIAPLLGVAPYSINIQIRDDIRTGKNSFPFPVLKIGSRVKIPKAGFIKFMKGELK